MSDVLNQPPCAPLSPDEIRAMIVRLRSAHVAASVNYDSRWVAIADAISGLQDLYRIETGEQY